MHRGKQSHAGQMDRHDKPHLIIKDLIVNDFEHKKWKKTIYMVTVLVIESLSIAQKPPGIASSYNKRLHCIM